MTTIYATATDQVLVATRMPKVSCNNQNTVKLHVKFDASWDGYAKSAVFYTSKDPTPYAVVLSSDGNCLVPAEVLIEEATLYIGVRGVKIASKEVKSTTPVKYKVLPGTPSLVISDPTPSVYQQLLSAYTHTGSALAVERARMDLLESKTTPEDSELLGIRVGSRGEVYDNAGTAVREQYNKVSDRLDDITLPSVNLFDKRRVTFGKFLSYDNTGETYNIDGFFVSDYIEVKPNTVYAINYSASAKMISQYDSSLNHISSATEWSITTAENASYIRFSHSIEGIDAVMLCEGVVPSKYTPYTERLNSDAFEPNAFDGDKIKVGTVSPTKMTDYRANSLNIFNKAEITDGVYLYYSNGELKEFDGYFTSEYIAVKPDTKYSSTYIEQVAFYDENATFINKLTSVANGFTTPNNARFIRVSDDNGKLDTMQINEGETLLPYDSFSYTFRDLKPRSRHRLYTLGGAWSQWASGKKFPIGILGDSTTDGASTTGWKTETGHEYLDNQNGGFGSYDYVNQNAYPYKLQQLIRNELNNDVMRVYNIGYSGYSFYTIMEHYDDIFSGVYSDVKMVGINMGINDRIPSGTPDKYYDDFRRHLVETIEYLYDKGIQPFIITSQATIEPYPDDSLGTFYPLRTSENINSIANRVKKEVAKEYGLELLDMTMYDEFIMAYSNHRITDIITDDLHYKDLGHTLEAEFLFSEISPRTIRVSDWAILDFSSQRLKSNCPSNKITYATNATERMKLLADYTKSGNEDIVMQDFIINITSKDPLALTAYCTAVGSQYVVVDGETVNITKTQQQIKTLEVGVHHIKAMSGASNKVNWIGFRLG